MEYEKIVVIEAGRSEKQYFRDLWHYRDLFYMLAWRDILVRYKQTAIGVAWAVIRPLLTMVVFTVIFGRIAKLPSESAPYAIMVFSALLPWQFFASAVTESGNSLVANSGIISKVYFPRIIIPTSTIIVGVVDFMFSFGVLLLLMAYYRFVPDFRILLIPIFLFIALLVSLGVGLLFGALNVKYRDFRYIIPFIVQFGLYISPVGFSSSVVPERWKLLYYSNPMVGVIDGFRWCILRGDVGLYIPGMLVSLCISILLLLCGFKYFRATERTFADIV